MKSKKRRHYEREVTRNQAIEWLKRVDPKKQRSMNSLIAKRYATDIDADRWQPGVAGVDFDSKGNLINGQHVLNGLLLSKKESICLRISQGHSSEAFAGFDKNRKRSAKDDLKIQGVDRAGDIASVATVLWQFEKGFFHGTSYTAARSGDRFPTSAEVCEVVRLHPGIHAHLWKNPFRGKGFSIGGLRAASYVLCQFDEKRAAKFFECLIEGIDIPTRDHPIGVLRREFLNLGKDERLRTGETLARIFKAWNFFIRGQSVPSGPLVRKNELFPELKPLPVVQPLERRNAHEKA